MSARWEVGLPTGEDLFEGLFADEWEIHRSGALLFWERHSENVTSFVIGYAPGAWRSFFQADEA